MNLKMQDKSIVKIARAGPARPCCRYDARRNQRRDCRSQEREITGRKLRPLGGYNEQRK